MSNRSIQAAVRAMLRAFERAQRTDYIAGMSGCPQSCPCKTRPRKTYAGRRGPTR